MNELAATEGKLERVKKRLTADAANRFWKRWRMHFDGKAKKAIWSELTEGGKHYPSLATFYAHVRESGIDRVLARYFDRHELPTVVRILGPGASELAAQIAQIERLEAELDEQRSLARRQAMN